MIKRTDGTDMEKEKMATKETLEQKFENKEQNSTEETLTSPTPKTEAEKIWAEISESKIDMFSLPNQTVSMHVTQIHVEPSASYIRLKTSATLPALETALGDKFEFEQMADFYKVSRKV